MQDAARAEFWTASVFVMEGLDKIVRYEGKLRREKAELGCEVHGRPQRAVALCGRDDTRHRTRL